MSKCERYAAARVLEGMSDAEARQAAGYKSKTPSPAQSLTAKLEMIAKASADLRQSAGVYADKAADLERRARVMRMWEKAARVHEEYVANKEKSCSVTSDEYPYAPAAPRSVRGRRHADGRETP